MFHGAVAWETGFIQRLYDFGQIKLIWAKDKNGRSIISGYKQGGHGTVRLVHALFYRIPGSTSPTDFGETNQLVKGATDEKIITSIVDVLLLCGSLRNFLTALAKELPVFYKLDTTDSLHILQNSMLQDNAIKEETWRRIGYNKELFNKSRATLRTTIHRSITKIWRIAHICEQKLETILNPVALKSLHDLKNNSKKGFAIVQSLLESDQNNEHALYLPYTTEMILLAFVYKKYGQDLEMLKLFYNTIKRKGGSVLFEHAWKPQCYQKIKAEVATEKLNAIFSKSNVAKNCEDILFCSAMRENYPKPNNYITVLRYEIGGLDDDMVDCMENAVRNFIRLLAYDKDTKLLSALTLQNQLSTIIDQNLKIFLSKNGDPSTDCCERSHHEWLKLVSNVPYVLYCRNVQTREMLQGTKKVLKNEPVTADQKNLYAFLMVPDENSVDEQWLTTNKIGVIHKNGYEIQPCMHNIIILLDHLLQLGLFDGKKMHEEIVNPKFVDTYFALLCKKLGCDGALYSSREISKNSIPQYFLNTIHAILEFKEFACCFTTDPGHGELNITQSAEKSDLVIPQKINTEQCRSLHLVITYLKNQSNIYDLSFLEQQQMYSNLFALPLDDNNQTTQLINAFRKLTLSTSHQLYEIVSLLGRVADKHPDENVRIITKMHLYQWGIEKNVQSMYTQAATVAGQAMVFDSNPVREAGFDLFEILLNKNDKNAFKVAAKIAHRLKTSKFNNMRDTDLNLFKILVKNNYTDVYEISTEAVGKAVISDQDALCRAGIELLKLLLEKKYEHAFKVASDIASEMVGSKNDFTYSLGLNLLRALVKHDYENNETILELATDKARHALTCQDGDDIEGLKLFRALFEKQYDNAFKVATRLAQTLAEHEDELSLTTRCKLLEELVKMNYKDAFKMAIHTASKEVMSAFHVKSKPVLLEEEEVPSTSLFISMSHLRTTSHLGRLNNGLRLFKTLLEKGSTQALKEAIAVHQKMLECSEKHISDRAKKLKDMIEQAQQIK